MYCESIFLWLLDITFKYVTWYVFHNCKPYKHALTIRYTLLQMFLHSIIFHFSSDKSIACIFISGKTMNHIQSQKTTLSQTNICT